MPQPFVFQTRAVCTHLLSLQRVMQRARRLIAITRSFTRAPARMQNAERACATDFHAESAADVYGFQLATSSESERRRHVEIFARARPARSALPLPRSFQSKREKRWAICQEIMRRSLFVRTPPAMDGKADAGGKTLHQLVNEKSAWSLPIRSRQERNHRETTRSVRSSIVLSNLLVSRDRPIIKLVASDETRKRISISRKQTPHTFHRFHRTRFSRDRPLPLLCRLYLFVYGTLLSFLSDSLSSLSARVI